MSDASPYNNVARMLRTDESDLIRALLGKVYPQEEIERTLADCRVVDMQDGGMGSIRFMGTEPRSFGRVLVEAQYLDSDGVLVSITVNADNHGRLFELDFWKVDFSPLRRYPTPSELSGISTQS